MFLEVDVSNAEEVNAAIEKTVERFGRLDVGVNNAGIIGEVAPILEMTDENWRNVLGINLDGVFYAMRAEARAMVKNGGSIINVASVNAFLGTPMAATYATSKHALLGLAKSAAGEFASLNIRVNTVCPGLVRTPMQDDIADKLSGGNPETFENPYLSRVPMARMAEPTEIANSILWLASDESTYFTGSALTPDGGIMA
jgi:NAD(P)-dependent dehydrogenase (short-subunit alcohol dehydrogenase family)